MNAIPALIGILLITISFCLVDVSPMVDFKVFMIGCLLCILSMFGEIQTLLLRKKP